MRILLSAFACAPKQGSEEGVGWELAWALSAKHRVHVLTTPRFRQAIDEQLSRHRRPNLSFSYFDFPPVVLKSLRFTALWQIYYHLWQCRIGTWAQSVGRAFRPDVVHHVTYCRYWTPSTLWKLGRPFIWGPLGGGDQCPRAFLPCLTLRGRFTANIRALAQWMARLDPRLRETALNCDAALAVTEPTAEGLRSLGGPRVDLWSHNAIEESMIAETPPSPDHPVTFCTVGRLLGWKGQTLAVNAFAEAAIPDSRLVIIGDGPAKNALQALALRRGVERNVFFTGGLPRDQTLGWMTRSVALLHPSLHDQAATVVYEALGLGVPVIALALGASADQIPPESGFVIEAHNPAQSITAMATAMRQLATDSGLRERMSAAGIAHVRAGATWPRRAERFEALYRELCHRPTDRAATAR